MDTELASVYSINGHKSNEEEAQVDSNVEVQMLREELDRINTEFLKVSHTTHTHTLTHTHTHTQTHTHTHTHTQHSL